MGEIYSGPGGSHGNPETGRPIKAIAAAEIFRATGEAIEEPDSGLSDYL